MKIVKQISDLDYGPEEWELFYFDDMSSKERDRSEQAARALNEAFMKAVNSGLDRYAVESAVEAVMDQYANEGATDTEPRYQLKSLLRHVFGED